MKRKLLTNLSVFLVLPLLLAHESVSWGDQPPLQPPPGLTLYSALAETDSKNPDLEAERAALKSAEELYTQAVAGFQPKLSGVADYTSTHNKFDAGTLSSDAKTLSLQMTQSVYSGGSTTAAAKEAENQIKATRATLQVTEQQVLLDAVTAYMNFLRDQEIVQLNLNNENVLTQHLQAAQERFRLGDITKTDVSQAESRLAKATASRIAADGALQKSTAFFEKVIGLPPMNLQKPASTEPLPATEGEAVEMAAKNNPSIAFAKYSANAAKNATSAIEGENLPQVGLTGSLGRIYNPPTGFLGASNSEDSRAIGITATLPLYTGGSTASRIRQSKQTENQLRMKTLSAENIVRQSVIEAWETLTTAEAESTARQAQIDAAKLALEGVKVESEFGSRTTLDLLDAEQEYLDAQVSHVTAETDRIIAAYGILSAVGKLTAEGLGLKMAGNESEANFQNILKE